MTNLSEVKKYFENEITKLEQAIENEKSARDDASCAMQSWSDTTRNQKEQLIQALETKLRFRKRQSGSVPAKTSVNGVWSVVHSKSLNSKCLIVPDGMGGAKIGDLILVSIDSLLAKELLQSTP
ncbi:hypothetical protein ACFL2C_00750 [Patescibacteria group bacterium]